MWRAGAPRRVTPGLSAVCPAAERRDEEVHGAYLEAVEGGKRRGEEMEKLSGGQPHSTVVWALKIPPLYRDS